MLTGKSVGKVVSKVSFGLLDLGFAIWDIVDGVNAINEGNAQAKAFRKAGDKVLELKKDINHLFGFIEQRCDGSSQNVNCQYTEWSSWGPCKNLDSSSAHNEEGLTCGDSVQERSRSMAFQDGTAQDAILCKQDGNSCGTGLKEIKPCGIAWHETKNTNKLFGKHSSYNVHFL